MLILYTKRMSIKASDILIRITNVSKKYRRGHESVDALHSISLDVYKGELLAIVGPSGSGKTTLTHIVGGLITPDAGTVEVQGKALKGRRDKQLSNFRNSEVGFVFQNFSLIPYYTVLENVTIPLVVAKMTPHERRELAKEYLKLVGLETKIHRRANELSGGERQRVIALDFGVDVS